MKLLPVFRFAVVGATLFAGMIAACPQPVMAGHLSRGMQMQPDKAPKGFDHLLCYLAEPINPFTSVNVTLYDQFYPAGFNAALQQVDNACTPAKKVLLYRKPIKGFKPNGHYVCYELSSTPEAELTTAYVNQLEKNSMYWYYAYFLCVPTYKYSDANNESPDMGAPKGYDHLMAYDSTKGGVTFENPLPATTVTIYDQFFPNGITTSLGNPVALLTPTKKYYPKGMKVKPNGHWVLYYFTAPPYVQEQRDYVNQLERNSLVAYFPNYLLVPTYKYPPSGGQVRPSVRRLRTPIVGQKPR